MITEDATPPFDDWALMDTITARRPVCATEIAGRLRGSDHVDEVETARAAGEDVSNTAVRRGWVIHPEACCRVQHTGCSRGFAPIRLQEYLDGWVYGVVRDVDNQPLLVGPVLCRRDAENVGDGDRGGYAAPKPHRQS